ncbi:MAG: class 1 fructose-bisphosphatase [bacterium]
MAAKRFMTLPRHILEGEKMHPEATGELSSILNQLSLAIKLISLEVNKAGLADILGFAGSTNISGDDVKKLDMFAHDTLIKAMDHGGHFCVMASEEEEEIIHIPTHHQIGKYVLLFDPLDGSSNIDANVSIGTIFSIYKRISEDGKPGTLEDCLQPGYKQEVAGYVVYGSSTMLVYTTGHHGIHGFTLDPAFGEFILSHENIRIPKNGRIYSVNEGNYIAWPDGIKKYLKHLQANLYQGKPYQARYIGSMVADVHRTLLYGGIYMYPGDRRNAKGKLRLVYECNPMAFIMEAAGGKATDGNKRILELKPESLHERTPLFIGSEEDVLLVEKFMQEEEG